MIIGVGTDIVKIDRIEKVLSQFGPRFLNRVFSAEEREKASRSHRPARTLASRFAAKEAAAKALGIAIRSGVRFSDFSVSNDKNGRPILKIAGKAAELTASCVPKGAQLQANLSLAEEDDYAVAFVVLSANTPV
ncbi:MAG: holo-ACP synthase [Alphaproteobacteria bacterium]|nr:MAG: holo-ACP synthase [Alphaproteobacteria bacterium]